MVIKLVTYFLSATYFHIFCVDVGFSNYYMKDELLKTFCGSPLYVPPVAVCRHELQQISGPHLGEGREGEREGKGREGERGKGKGMLREEGCIYGGRGEWE